jgi:hypothetical protein
VLALAVGLKFSYNTAISFAGGKPVLKQTYINQRVTKLIVRPPFKE